MGRELIYGDTLQADAFRWTTILFSEYVVGTFILHIWHIKTQPIITGPPKHSVGGQD